MRGKDVKRPDLEGFVIALLEHFGGWSDIDGGYFQDTAVAYGVLAGVNRVRDCGEYCACAELDPDGFPLTCYVWHPSILAASQAREAVES